MRFPTQQDKSIHLLGLLYTEQKYAKAIYRFLPQIDVNFTKKTLTDHTSYVYSVAFHPTQPLFSTGSSDNKVHIYDLRTWTLTKTLTDHTPYVNSVAFHPTQPLFATGACDKKVQVYNTDRW